MVKSVHVLLLVGLFVAAQGEVKEAEPTHRPLPTTPPPAPTPPSSNSSTTSTTTPASTTASTTSTTTQKSTTASTTPPPPPPTTTKQPEPAPPKPSKPDTGKWVVNQTDSINKTCIVVQLALQLDLPYPTTFNKTYRAYVNIPKNATSTGDCGQNDQLVTLTWSPAPNVSDSVALSFKRNATAKDYKLDSIQARITPDSVNFPGFRNNTVIQLYHTKSFVTVPLGMSYKCAKEETVNFSYDPESNETDNKAVISNLQLEAFHNETGENFHSARDCQGSDTPDVVPIAVGCALAILVLIVLGAYLYGRRRSQARGYLSMFTETKREEDYIPMKTLPCFGR